MNLINPEPPKHCRHIFDPEKTREWMKKNVKEAFTKKLNMIETGDYKLEVTDIDYKEPKEKYSFDDQRMALLDKRDLTTPLKGTFKLIHKPTDKVIAEKITTIAHLPYLTERNTSILNGSEYITINQQRLKPGVYTRIKESGEAEAHVNVRAGTGLGGKVIFYPDKALFVYNLGTTQIPLYGLLHDLGVSDDTMRQYWGAEIFLKNKLSYKGDEIDKFYHKIFER